MQLLCAKPSSKNNAGRQNQQHPRTMNKERPTAVFGYLTWLFGCAIGCWPLGFLEKRREFNWSVKKLWPSHCLLFVSKLLVLVGLQCWRCSSAAAGRRTGWQGVLGVVEETGSDMEMLVRMSHIAQAKSIQRIFAILCRGCVLDRRHFP